jgi:hypothetical protein
MYHQELVEYFDRGDLQVDWMFRWNLNDTESRLSFWRELASETARLKTIRDSSERAMYELMFLEEDMPHAKQKILRAKQKVRAALPCSNIT